VLFTGERGRVVRARPEAALAGPTTGVLSLLPPSKPPWAVHSAVATSPILGT